jgi:DNA-binding response OmpR family regulator
MPKILVIEDEENLQEVVTINLTLEGYQIYTAKTGEEALILAQKIKPDLILTDIKMPGMNGWDTLAAMRKIPSLAAVPAIIMTAFLKEPDQTTLTSLGVKSIIWKPFNLEEMFKKVKQALG